MEEPINNQVTSRPLPARNVFDEEGYLLLHPDVAAAVVSGIVDSGWQHFTLHGFAEGRQWLAKPDPLIGVLQEIPPHDEMFCGNAAHYFDVGESALHCIETALFAARRSKSSIRTILDLPCGHGRVLRFLHKAFPEARLTACDLNADGVDYCAKAFGALPVHSQENAEAMEFHDQFDLIWCGSLLTHLPEEKCASFLRLFQRILHPRGILVFTTHGRHCEGDLAAGKNPHGLDERQVAELLRSCQQRGGFGYVDYSAHQPGYGISLARPAFVMANFIQQSGWQLLGYHERGWDKRQDVICLQKEAESGCPAPES